MHLDKKNKKVLVICPHPYGHVPGQRLKFEQYYEHWRKSGYDVEVSSFMSVEFQKIVYTQGNYIKKIKGTLIGYVSRIRHLFKIRKYEIVYIFLWVTPFGPPLFEFLYRCYSNKVIYDIDDLVYKKKTSPVNKIISILKSSKKAFFLMKKADHVLVSTSKLYEVVRIYNKNITVIPATINVDDYPNRVFDDAKKIVIGWSGSHTTSKYLYLIIDVLEEITKKFDIEIHIMGDLDFNYSNLPNLRLIKWTSETEIESLMTFDIGIHPVDEDEWSLGKSGGKLVQYMAASLPIIATFNEPNRLAIVEGETGYLAKSKNDWIEKLSLLITNQTLKNEMSLKSRKRAEDFFSVKINSNKYLNVFEKI
jgi:glycosyltransferase involved in cell wall biosynthesis